MNIKVPFAFKQDLDVFMRRASYAQFRDPNTGITSYTKRFGKDFYPRFHVYINQKDGSDIISLHLDQKKPSYPGAHAHSGEYDGPVVEREADRLRGLIKNQLDNQDQQENSVPEKKEGFFSKFFG